MTLEDYNFSECAEENTHSFELLKSVGFGFRLPRFQLIHLDPKTPGMHKTKDIALSTERECLELYDSINTGELLKQCLDYCSHAWPSDQVHESLLSNLSYSGRPEPDPTDLSTVIFSDASDDGHDSSYQVKETKNEQSRIHLQASAVNPALTSKHAKIACMQRMLNRDIQKKYQNGFDNTAHHGDPETEVHQHSLGCSAETASSLEKRNSGPEAFQQEADLGMNESIKTKEADLDSWCTSITRKHQREVSMKELKMQELSYLRSNFGKVMKDLESAQSAQLKSTSASKAEEDHTFSAGNLHQNQNYTEKTDKADEDDFIPEVASIQELSQSECRRLLQQLKQLVHAPAALYRALVKRALDEYVNFQPRSFFDCRRITFWQFGTSKERQQRGRSDRSLSALFSIALLFVIVATIAIIG